MKLARGPDHLLALEVSLAGGATYAAMQTRCTKRNFATLEAAVKRIERVCSNERY